MFEEGNDQTDSEERYQMSLEELKGECWDIRCRALSHPTPRILVHYSGLMRVRGARGKRKMELLFR